jgi:AraC-like DNA-binding protein
MAHRETTLEQWARIAEDARWLIGRLSGEHLVIDDVADRLRVSRRLLQEVLAYARTDFSRELYMARMKKAGRLIGLGWRVGDTARACGFASPSHFCVAFSKTYGLAPSELGRAMKLYNRLEWRTRLDETHPVATSSREYSRRRRRWREDRRKLDVLIAKMTPASREALLRAGSGGWARGRSFTPGSAQADHRGLRAA